MLPASTARVREKSGFCFLKHTRTGFIRARAMLMRFEQAMMTAPQVRDKGATSMKTLAERLKTP